MLELTPTQRDIYFEGKFFGGIVNNIGGYQKYFCELDVSRFARARELLLCSNDAYRLRFIEEEGVCRPMLADDGSPALTLVDCSQEMNPREYARAWIQERFEAVFDDLASKVFQDALLKIASDEFWYFAKAHHLIMDGWGFGLQMRRFIELYDRLECEELETVQYPSFVEWSARQADYRASKVYADDLNYWLERHPTGGGHLVPQREAWGAAGHASSQRVSTVVERVLFQSLGELAGQVGANITTIFHVALYTYFSRAYHNKDIIISSPVHNRRSANDKNIIGSLVNINACRLSASGDESFADLVRKIAQDQKRDYRHSRFPIGDLVRALRDRDGGQDGDIHQVVFNYQRLDFGLTVGGRPVETYYLTHNHERTPVTFVVCEYGSEQDIAFHLDYNCACFDEIEAREVLDRVHGLLSQVAADFARPIDSLSLLTPAEWQRQFVDWNATDVEGTMPACIDHCFERQAQETPDRVAIAWHGGSMTYAQLNGQANQVAHRLLAMGVQPEQLIGVYLPRTPSLIVALLATLKVGACYVPIDTAYPAARVRYILEDSAVSVVLTDANGPAGLPEGSTCLDIDAILAQQSMDGAPENPDRLRRGTEQSAYVIYTSGSTGRPKGVLIEHRNAVALIDWAAKTYTSEDLRAVLAATSVCFDLSVFEIFVPLATGGSIVLVDNVLALCGGIEHDVTLINTVPSAIKALLENGSIPARVRCINLAGELLRQELVELICEGRDVKVFDLYGPSEDTTYSTCARRRSNGQQTIGRPIHNTRAYVFDDNGNPLPVGLTGELHLAGAGLARGYLNQPELTDERFVYNPHARARAYRTGDLVRLTRDGELQYVGRKDHQVKIRGYRIEPGEIEANIARQTGVEACVVVVRDDAQTGVGKMLVAYLMTRRVDPAAQADADERLVQSVRELLIDALPVYMIPEQFVCLDQLPLTSNGKIDRSALPVAAGRSHQTPIDEAPRTETQKRICRLWQEVLGIPVPSVSESFFRLGGDSLLLVKLATRFETEFASRVDLPSLFANTTVQAQAEQLDRQFKLTGLLSRIKLADDEKHGSYIDL